MNDAEKQFERIVAGLNIDDSADSRHKTALREQMLAAYAQSASSKSSRSVWQTWSKIMKSNITKTAAAAIILIGAFFFLTQGKGTTLAWADVVEQIKELRPYECTRTTYYNDVKKYSARVMHLNQSQRREKRDNGDVYVFDLRECPVRTLSFNDAKKYARLSTNYSMGPAKDPDFLLMLSRMKESDAQRLDLQTVHGVRVQGFRTANSQNDITIWADVETGRPVKLEVIHPQADRKIVFEDFVFDVQYQNSLFATMPPEGYDLDIKISGLKQYLAKVTLSELSPAKQLELALAGYETADMKTLAALFEAGTTETKLAVANYLSEIGTDEAFEALKLLETSDTEQKVRQAVKQGIESIEKQKESQSADTNSPPIKPQPEPEVPFENTADDLEKTAVEAKAPIEAKEGSPIVIKVVEKDTGKPIDDADIRTYDRGSKYFKTDADGICVVTAGLNGGTCINLFAAKDGYVGQGFSVGEGRFIDYFPEEVVFKLEKGTIIGGIVTDSAGNPLEGVKVHFIINDGDGIDKAPETDVRFEQKTDKDGRWICNTAPADIDWFSIYADYADYATGRSYVDKNEIVQQLRAQTHVIQMDAGYSIIGMVKDEAGNPVKGARLQLGSWYGQNDRDHRTYTDESGYFDFLHLTIGKWGPSYEFVEGQGTVPVRRHFEYITVTADGFAPQSMQVFFKEKQMDLEFVLIPGEPINGRVVDFEGNPVAGATVRADDLGARITDEIRSIDWNTKTDSEGRFVWQHAPVEKVRLVISKKGYMDFETQRLLPSESEYEFVLNPKVRVKGQVVDAVTKEPITEFIFRRHEGGYISSPKQIAESEGRFETAFAEQGETFTITFEADGYKPAASRKISLIEQDVELRIEMQPDAGIDGVVVDIDGKPLEGVRVIIPKGTLHIDNMKIELSRLRYHYHTKTDAQGRFHLGPVAQEKYSLLVLEETGYLYIHSPDFPEDGRFALQPYATIVGTYFKGSKPVANKRISINYPRYHQVARGNGVWEMGLAFDYFVQTDNEGQFVFDKLIHGTARILIEPTKYVELNAGETKEIQLGGDGLMVTGHFLTPNGEVLNAGFGDCSIRLQRIYDTLPFPESEWPLPDNADVMDYAALMKWFAEFSVSDDGGQWIQDIQDKYGELQKDYTEKTDTNGRFEMPNVEPGTYLLTLRVRPWQDPDNFPRQVDYDKGQIAFASSIVVVPEFETAEQMDTPVDVGTLQSRKSPLVVGDPAPDFNIEKLKSAGRIRLSDYRGKTVLLNFTAPMFEEIMPDKAAMLKKVCEQTAAKAAVFNVAVEQLPWKYMRKKMKPACTLPGVYGVAQMGQSKIYVDYEVGQIPQSILIGPEGKILWKGEPGEELLDLLADLS